MIFLNYYVKFIRWLKGDVKEPVSFVFTHRHISSPYTFPNSYSEQVVQQIFRKHDPPSEQSQPEHQLSFSVLLFLQPGILFLCGVGHLLETTIKMVPNDFSTYLCIYFIYQLLLTTLHSCLLGLMIVTSHFIFVSKQGHELPCHKRKTKIAHKKLVVITMKSYSYHKFDGCIKNPILISLLQIPIQKILYYIDGR